MGFRTENHINAGNVGSQGANLNTTTIQTSKIDLSQVERATGEINNERSMTTVDFGEIFGKANKAVETTAQTVVSEDAKLAAIEQKSETVSSTEMNAQGTDADITNKAEGTEIKNQETIKGEQGTGQTNQTGGTATGSGASGGSSGGSWGPSGGSSSAPKTSGGMSGVSKPGSNGASGVDATGVKTNSSSMKSINPVVATGLSVNETGAIIPRTMVTSVNTEKTNVSQAERNTGAWLGRATKWFVKEAIKVKDFFDSLISTKIVIATSVFTAVGNIVEAVVIDGLFGYVIAGALDLLGADDLANELRKFAARDLMGELNKSFYEDTEIGKHINEMSTIKYDSEFAKKITSFSETVIKIVAATAIAALPGGTILLIAIGGLEGMGNAAEGAYQNALANGEEDLTLGFWQNMGIIGSGALDAMAWVMNAKLGQGFLNIAGDIAELGLKEVGGTLTKQLFSKETMRNALKPMNVIMNSGQSLLQSGGKIGVIYSKFMNGEKITMSDWTDLAMTFGLYFLLNTAQDSMREYVSGYTAGGNVDFETRNLTTKKAKSEDTTQTATEVEGTSKTGFIDEDEPTLELGEDFPEKVEAASKTGFLDDDEPTLELGEDFPEKVAVAGGAEKFSTEAPKDVELTPAEKIAKEKVEFEDRQKRELEALDRSDLFYFEKKSLIEAKIAKEEELMKIAHEKGMSFEDYVKSFKSAETLSPEQQKRVAISAKKISERAILEEPKITEVMEELEGDGAYLEGLEFKLKSEDSIADKLSRKIADGSSLEYAEGEMRDTVRYTLIVSEENYETDVLSRLRALQDQGYEVVDSNNAWGASKYQGLNVILKTPSTPDADGIYFELQFHTPESFRVKQANHLFYELSRTEGVPQGVKDMADDIMISNQKLGVNDTGFRHNTWSMKEALTNYQPYKRVPDLTPMQPGETVYDVMRRKNPKAKGYTWDEFSAATEEERIAWEKWLRTQEYVDGKTGRVYTYEDAVLGYIGESDTDPCGYAVVNTVNRAKGANATETLSNLIVRDSAGNPIMENGEYVIHIYHTGGWTTEYRLDPLTGIIHQPGHMDRGLNLDGTAGTIDDLLDRVDSESVLLDKILNGIQFKEEIIVRRGTDLRALKKFGITGRESEEEIYKKLTASGSTYVDDGFMSTSPDMNGGFPGEVQFVISTKKGSGYGNFSKYNEYEQETLLNFGSKFDIVAVKKDESGIINIFLKQK